MKAAIGYCDHTIAPSLYRVEVANAIRTMVVAGQLDSQAADYYFESGMQLIDEFVDEGDLMVEALHEALRFNHSVYDLLYVILARRSGGALITKDSKLFRVAARAGVTVYFDADV
ncbi:MAG: type II toxin-antitoxin system VapC family toxin [Coriobacteriales bacterium]|jgi:predicted nucleic acid-binding protein|nr:type II toxin-antitoxin system VapC family toxin [Coriobacteriales bacterium]